MSQTSSQVDQVRGRAVVMQPEDGPSYWQPVPANGHADPKLYPARTGFSGLSMGFQTIAPGSRVREHSHGDQIELQICFRGKGRVVVDGQSHPLRAGTSCFLGYDIKHELINESAQDDLVMLWVITPHGLEHFFETIGRPRSPGDPAPAPFERPADVIAIERRLGMNDTR
jgi:quercetin dioxygenase-like cupin family protein